MSRFFPATAAVALALACALAPVPSARADDKAPSPAAVVHRECGACHIAYLPKFLAAPAWTKLFDTLDNHFGESAVMAPDVTAVVRRYYLDHSAGLFWISPSTQEIPRITAQTWWKKAMGKLDVSNPRIRSKANCGACHTHADWYMGVRE